MKNNRQGFSLVEVVLVMGLVAMCITPLLGLLSTKVRLPIGLNKLKSAGRFESCRWTRNQIQFGGLASYASSSWRIGCIRPNKNIEEFKQAELKIRRNLRPQPPRSDQIRSSSTLNGEELLGIEATSLGSKNNTYGSIFRGNGM